MTKALIVPRVWRVAKRCHCAATFRARADASSLVGEPETLSQIESRLRTPRVESAEVHIQLSSPATSPSWRRASEPAHPASREGCRASVSEAPSTARRSLHACMTTRALFSVSCTHKIQRNLESTRVKYIRHRGHQENNKDTCHSIYRCALDKMAVLLMSETPAPLLFTARGRMHQSSWETYASAGKNNSLRKRQTQCPLVEVT